MTTVQLHDPYVRLATRTGVRTAMRGPTDHGRPAIVDLLQLRPDRRRRLAIRRRISNRRGPVSGCTSVHCWHTFPHWAWSGS